jgi:hypothetical protein
VTTKQIEDYLSSCWDRSRANQYLRDTRVPTLEYYFKDSTLSFRWINCVKGFNMPVKIFKTGKKNGSNRLPLSSVLSTVENPKLKIDANFYVAEFDITE